MYKPLALHATCCAASSTARKNMRPYQHAIYQLRHTPRTLLQSQSTFLSGCLHGHGASHSSRDDSSCHPWPLLTSTKPDSPTNPDSCNWWHGELHTASLTLGMSQLRVTSYVPGPTYWPLPNTSAPPDACPVTEHSHPDQCAVLCWHCMRHKVVVLVATHSDCVCMCG